MVNVPNLFGSMVFNDAVMQSRLPKDTYKALKRTIARGSHLELDVANIVANAMKDWAVEKGVTHYTHWFQPMTGITAEKHDSFIAPAGDDRIIMEFSGKFLVKGEPDASSFPSGGLRATFEARGYTAWDPTSYAFIKNRTLCIPTVFCSYSGHALDKKTPLLRSMEALDKQALRILKLFGKTGVKRVLTTLGPEQEYFLIDKEMYLKRPDLMFCGRTLLGAKPPKGQELDDHYFGAIKSRVLAFMKELDEELWKLGILAKTKHNEVAPAQHELATVFNTANIATDQNQITMELMKSIANKHGLACLLHEKPFAGINGSGKHNNWSLSTDKGVNLLEPGDTPAENAQFILFLLAVIKATDEYQDLIRLSVSSAANDHRLGSSEAPPAIISIFLGDELMDILAALENGTDYRGRKEAPMEIGVTALPHFPKDSTDRNRTSPLAFTGNKFEFRMPGSALSIAGPNFVLNTAVAEALRDFADKLESCDDFTKGLDKLVKETIKKHKRIVFNGNNYSDDWVREAEMRGLSNLKSTVESLPFFIKRKNMDLFVSHNVLSEAEVFSRYEILLENYSKSINIEALTMIDMVKRNVIPAVIGYQSEIAELIFRKKNCGDIAFSTKMEENILTKMSALSEKMYDKLNKLEEDMQKSKNKDSLATAGYYSDTILSDMSALRIVADELETLLSDKHRTLPTYAEILYSVN